MGFAHILFDYSQCFIGVINFVDCLGIYLYCCKKAREKNTNIIVAF